MKTNILFTICITVLAIASPADGQDLPVSVCHESAHPEQDYSRSREMNRALQQLVNNGVPGAAIAVYSDEGWWTSAAGYANIEARTPMQTCHLQYLQSISKTYMAVAVLRLFETGKIDLDEPITEYLPSHLSRIITDAETITVRMLLNHTSGIPEYNFSPDYVTYLLQHPGHFFSAEEYLAYIDDKPLDFTPGSRYSYRNTNYMILALITDAITGNHARYISETIFQPLHLHHTHYRYEPGYLTYPTLVNSYWDRYGNGIVENASLMQRTNVASLIGDDGIVTTPGDAVRFLKGLIEGELLSPSTLELMRTWVHDSEGEPRYGLGLGYTTILEHTAYGHSGGGIGAGCELYYFPEENVYVFVAINLGTVTGSPLHEGAGEARDNLYKTLLE